MVRILVVVLAFAVSSLAVAESDRTPPLVDASWLDANLNQDNLVVLDVRSGIDNGGDRSSFQKAHIPGSVYSSYTGDGWRESRGGVAGLLPPVTSLERLIGGLGISNDDVVVVVPAGTGATDFGSAARVYWTFRVLGHNDVTILNGGFSGWQAAGFEVASGESGQGAVTKFKGSLQQNLIASLEEVQNARGTQAQLVDARPSDYFRGENKSPAVKSLGTIPGARSMPHGDFLGERGQVWYLNQASITERVNQAELNPGTRTIAFCNTGHWAATDWFVLSELAGFEEVALYDGSMAEWSLDRSRPIQVAKKGLGKVLDWFN
ncbi:thiosulfate/3-mercaptopyruvate sulfurtransferase [Marinobacter sp. LV10R520-4]|uniref:sulfurtransferase n=1 Tax=Marinobacter sp. LV10R520-4 TaxID=1761796 RepID=UPI000BF68D39|nr:sulfurtransferase [Marinobacter sp. LV10R520-4]PFG52359.1 thiosulfate/3-mercaptopyruvate sulfurtransferase [Marinobacter sp. LV10R520-4]